MEIVLEKLGLIKEKAVKYATLVESMIDDSIEGLTAKNMDLLRRVIKEKEPLANIFEIELDEMSIRYLALLRPEAKDLRSIVMVAKMSNDFERIGDHAVNIAKSGIFLIDKQFIKPLREIPKMAALVRGMVSEAIDAFVREDVALAKQILIEDDQVDEFRDVLMNEIMQIMKSSPESIERAMHLMSIIRNLERIGDLATNMSEDVIYIIDGKVVKHHTGDDEDIPSIL
ncbi:MAG: phosphate transport system regulatory protein PhoU [Spirochaetes bacterium GWF1_49_6]|nr:MAG: phosphate transport system regulatory protein PhoU [Spirochaetes bacterium GWF1_49_6]